MAYNNGYQFYPQQYYQPPMMQQQAIQQSQQPQQQIQNGGFMLVPSEDIVRTYPVAPGNCVTFKIEGQPIVMEKSMGFSQLETPRIDKYRLIREEDIPQEQKQEEPKECSCNKDIEQLKAELEELRGEIDVLRGQISKPTTSKKKETGGA